MARAQRWAGVAWSWTWTGGTARDFWGPLSFVWVSPAPAPPPLRASGLFLSQTVPAGEEWD